MPESTSPRKAAKSLWERATEQIRKEERGGVSTLASRAAAAIVTARSSPPAKTVEKAVAEFYDVGIKALQLAAAGGFPQYARDRLRIRTKSGQLLPFALNRAQMYVHELAEAQIQRRGYVRLIVLKGRQMGLSTYILGRGYFKVTRKTGQKAYILAHELNASNNLFGIVKGMHDGMDERLKPQMGRSNARELVFPNLKGGYTVGTAKSGETGRSFTVQFFHGSEVAFWAAAKQIAAGLMQTIGPVPGTEIWLESTANGPGNFFHSAVQSARKGETDFEVDFCPWYWDSFYRPRRTRSRGTSSTACRWPTSSTCAGTTCPLRRCTGGQRRSPSSRCRRAETPMPARSNSSRNTRRRSKRPSWATPRARSSGR